MMRSLSNRLLNPSRSKQMFILSASVAYVLLFASQSSSSAQSPRATASPVVRIVYLVPADRVVRDDYVERLEAAIQHLRIWTRNEMGDGTTFSTNRRVVEVVHTSQVAAWYSTNPSGEYALWFWTNVLTEAFALTGAKFSDPNNTWVFYIDSDQGCEQSVGATSGVVLLPANDLRGLAGEPNVPPCAGAPPDTAGVCRWVGGLGHELGHAFGLPHPPGCDDSDPNTMCPSNTLMFLGYITYPQTFLLETDKEALAQSGFFSPVRLRRSLPECSGERRR